MAYEAKTKATKLSVASYLDAIKDPARRKDCKTLATLMTRVTGCKPVLWGVDLTVPAGQLIGIIGPNGAGKSTLIKACMGLLPVQSGWVKMFGQPFAKVATRVV